MSDASRRRAASTAAAPMPRLSIPTRVFLGFALVLVSFGAVALASLLQHQRTARTLRLLHEGYLPLALTLGDARASQTVFATVLDRVVEERDTSASRSWLGIARRIRPAAVRRALGSVELARALAIDANDAKALAQVHAELGSVIRAYEENDDEYIELFRWLEDGGDDARARALHASVRRRERDVQRRFREAWTRLQGRLTATSADAAEQERRAAALLGFLALAALAVGITVTLWSQRVLRPIRVLHERVAAVARGDLAQRLLPTSSDELGRLAREFERMVEALAARDHSLREAAAAEALLKKQEEQIVAGLRAGVVVIDAGGRVRSMNPAARLILGPFGFEVGEVASSLGAVIDAAIADVQAGASRVERAAEPLGGRATATHRDVDVLVTPFGQARDGERRAALLVVEDVTDELATKQRLVQSERLAAIGRMAAHVTHEVRNPLSSIGLNVEMLEEELGAGDSGADARQLLRAIHREIDRLTAVTEEYLRLARLPSPRLEPEDLGDLVRSVAELVRPEMDAAGIVFDVRVEAPLPVVPVDEGQLRQALLNLLRNARESIVGAGRVTIAVHAGEGVVRLHVRDTGQGMGEEERARMFELFYTTKDRGSGLGLPLTQQIVEAHGGTLTCTSARGEGTTFVVELPHS